MKKKWIGLLMVLSLIVSLMVVPNKVQAKDKGYLVVVQKENNGGWVAYENMACASPEKNIMIQAYSMSKILGFSYKNSDNNFTIANGKKKLTFTKNSTGYKYYDGSKTINKTATYKSYSSKAFGKAVNLVHYATLGNLSVYTQYYSGSKAADYKVLGYKGIVCYSTIGKITSIPNINKVVDINGNKLENDTSNYGNSNFGYDGTITIGGVHIPKLDGFSDAYDDTTGHWGADVKGNTPLEDSIREYSAQMKKDIIALNDESNGGSTAKISVSDNTILVEANGDSTLSAIRLYKTNNGYEIYLSTALVYTDYDKKMGNANYTKISNNALRLLCAIISSESETLYKAIYSEWEGNNDYGINKTSYVDVGDCQVKYRTENGHAGIYSIKAK